MEIGVRPQGRAFLAHAFVFSGSHLIVGNENSELVEFKFLSTLQSDQE